MRGKFARVAQGINVIIQIRLLGLRDALLRPIGLLLRVLVHPVDVRRRELTLLALLQIEVLRALQGGRQFIVEHGQFAGDRPEVVVAARPERGLNRSLDASGRHVLAVVDPTFSRKGLERPALLKTLADIAENRVCLGPRQPLSATVRVEGRIDDPLLVPSQSTADDFLTVPVCDAQEHRGLERPPLPGVRDVARVGTEAQDVQEAPTKGLRRGGLA
jgi:hypothetical protein